MNETTKRRLVGAAVLVAVGVLLPVLVVWWAQPDDGLDGESVRVYEINKSGEAVPVGEGEKTAAKDGEPSEAETGPADAGAGGGGKRPADGQSATASRDGADTAPAEPRPDETRGTPEVERAPEPEPQAPPQTASAEPPAAEPDDTAEPEPSTSESAAEPAADEPGWVVQIGSFSEAANARQMKADVPEGYRAFIATGTVNGQSYHRVRVGPYPSEAEAEAAAGRLGEAGYATQVQRRNPEG